MRSGTTLDELGFSSLERVELMSELEDRFDVWNYLKPVSQFCNVL